MIDILFFGRVADSLGKRRLAMALPPEGLSLFALRLRLFDGEDDGRLRMSVNQVVVTDDRPLYDGDEVAFFSVFSGG
ncbi:MoaD/ThiS family protein [Asticcacaulis taihuensis]|uniref:MoaD/ThiS family protein n=1 Tax=Asticcacaulis taihuensis TaxID=260084 RepID=UPI0026F09C79|nr:MoaD/ThiS family protein [Asticcacaulis taihuensis]